MRLACEEFVLNVLPVIRKIIVRKLYNNYGMSQKEIARRLRITQAAVSQYIKGIRGKGENKLDKEILDIVDKICKEIYNGRNLSEVKELFCEICSLTTDEKCKIHS